MSLIGPIRSSLLTLGFGAAVLPYDAAAAPLAAKLACPDGTTQVSLKNRCGGVVGCVPGGAEDPAQIRGPVQEFDLTGTKRAEYTLLSSLRRTGTIKTWHANGKRRLEARYVETHDFVTPSRSSNFDGVVTEWYSNERKHAEATYKRGVLQGVARLWSPSTPAVLRIESNWLEGEADGKWKAFFADGKPEVELTMKRGNLRGPVTLWASTGQKIEEFTEAIDGKQGPHRTWTPLGQLLLEERYEKGQLQGKHTELFPGGQHRIESTYKDDNLDGPYSEWFESGQPKSQGGYAGGKQDGNWKVWYPNGQLRSESLFADGRELPGWKRYFADGKLAERLGADGVYEKFHANGSRSCMGTQGPKGRTGSWVWYDEQGRVERTGVIVKDRFRDGVLAEVRCARGTKPVRSTEHRLRWVSCRDSKQRDHGMRYIFSEYGEGDYLTERYERGKRQDLCPEGVAPYFCRSGLPHPPFEVLRRRGTKHVEEIVEAPEIDAKPLVQATTTIARPGDECGYSNTDGLPETLDAFVAHVEVWNPDALRNPERVDPNSAATSSPSAKRR
jgi:antitoxin component YwqK of YwqJK toxin-antitoxin module